MALRSWLIITAVGDGWSVQQIHFPSLKPRRTRVKTYRLFRAPVADAPLAR
jgi:hypothetical protein